MTVNLTYIDLFLDSFFFLLLIFSVQGLMCHWKSHLEEVQTVNKSMVAMVSSLTRAETAVKKNETKLVTLQEKHGLQEDVVVTCEKELERQKGLVNSFTAEYECARKVRDNYYILY